MKRLLPVLMGFALLLLSSTVGWSLPSCPGSPTSSWSIIRDWTDCVGTFTGPDGKWKGDKYVGEFKDGTFHGHGTYYFSGNHEFKGDKYVGEFRKGIKHGQGTLTFASGDKYVGQFKDNKKHGHGTYTFASGNKYVGQFKDGKKNGQGTYYFLADNQFKGDIYVGEFKDGKSHGQGTHTHADGRVKEGIWENDKFLYAKKPSPTVTANQPCPGTYKPTWDNCTGTRTFSDKSRYTGQWKSGKHHGQGTLTYADGEKYRGGFRDGLHHGEGTITHANGKTLKGIWENDKFKSARD